MSRATAGWCDIALPFTVRVKAKPDIMSCLPTGKTNGAD